MGTATPPEAIERQESHVDKAREAIHALHTAHDEAATPLDRFVDGMAASLGRPIALISFLTVVCVWMVWNLWNSHHGGHAFDASPFPDLEFMISVAELFVVILILASQRRADRLADAREGMTLELSLQTAQKVSKVIELLEELRRDSPIIPDRVDPEATDMANRRADTEVLENAEADPSALKP